jgi:Ulp1 family protease
MIRIKTTAMAITSKMWMNPFSVTEVTTPNSHRISRMTNMVQSMMGVDKASCRVYNSTVQTISTGGSGTQLTFDTERWDSQAMHSTVSNTSRITIPTNWSGQYNIGAMVAWAIGNPATRQIALFLNATYYLSVTTTQSTSTLNDGLNVNTLWACAAVNTFPATKVAGAVHVMDYPPTV